MPANVYVLTDGWYWQVQVLSLSWWAGQAVILPMPVSQCDPLGGLCPLLNLTLAANRRSRFFHSLVIFALWLIFLVLWHVPNWLIVNISQLITTVNIILKELIPIMATTAIVEPMKQITHIVWLLICNALLQGVTSSNTTTSSSTITSSSTTITSSNTTTSTSITTSSINTATTTTSNSTTTSSSITTRLVAQSVTTLPVSAD